MISQASLSMNYLDFLSTLPRSSMSIPYYKLTQDDLTDDQFFYYLERFALECASNDCSMTY